MSIASSAVKHHGCLRSSALSQSALAPWREFWQEKMSGPLTYSNKGEEDLRDHLLLQLAPRVKNEGSVTGETFSKVGKTDILYRHNNSNAFIAECKFWKGQAKYLEAITQLLNYLIWRDSQAATIIFVKNKEMSSVLEIIRQVTPQLFRLCE